MLTYAHHTLGESIMNRLLFIICGIAITCAVLFTVESTFPEQFNESLNVIISRNVQDGFDLTLPSFVAKAGSVFIYLFIITVGGILGDIAYRGLKGHFNFFSKK